MRTKSMKKVLESLVAIKASLHDVAETSVDEKLDEAIELVERCIKNGKSDSTTTNEVLIIVGKVLEKLPGITALLKLFSD